MFSFSFLTLDPGPSMFQNILVIFAKAPVEGQVKTRLCPSLTPAQAAELARCFLIDTVERACSLPGVQVYVAFTPADSEAVFRALLPFPVQYLAQRGSSLGERELNIFLDLQQKDASRIVLIGSDIPTLPDSHLQEAFIRLEDTQCDAVFGPSSDGGYYLVGTRDGHRALFENIPWSTPTVMEETLAQARRHNLKVVLVPRWYDVDDEQDLHRLIVELSEAENSASHPRHTRAALVRFGLCPPVINKA
jgi:rSAM/selenodomain-associated transferase 1